MLEARGFPICEELHLRQPQELIFMIPTTNPFPADQARDAYRQMTDQLGHLGLNTAVAEGVRALAEKSAIQTREACDRGWDAFDASVRMFDDSFEAAGQGATAFNRRIVKLSRRSFDESFDLATGLARAKNLADIVERQAAFSRKQFDILTALAEEVSAMWTKVNADAAVPIKAQVMRGVDQMCRVH